VSDLMASFWIQRTGSTSIFEIGVMTDKDDHTTFEPLDTIPSPTVDLWNYIDVPLSQYTGTGKYIAFRVTQGTSCGFRMDDITLDYIPSCWRPSNFTVSNVTATSVDLSWTPAGTETEWIVEYMSNSETDWNVMSSSTTSLTISGLDSNATYSFRVKANCGAGDESNYTETLTATTLPCSNACVYVLTMHDSFGDSWNGNTINIVVNGATVATATVSSGYDETVTYYQCDAAEVNFSWTPGSYARETSFTIADAEGNTLYTCSNGNNLTSGAVFFTHTCGTITCPTPTALYVTNTSQNSVTLAWTENGNASEWNIVYGVPGFNPNTGGTIVTANTNPFTVDNLSADVYEFYVQANCDANDQSAWAGPVNATPGAINMPVSGSQTINACGGLIYDNGGLTNDYSSNCNGSLTINPDAPGMMVQVTGTYDTESSYDELTIYDGASTSGTSLGTYSGSGSINVTSTTGPLTLYFSSDGSVQHSGFQLTVNCVGGGTSDCNDPSNVQASNITTTGATITWTPGGTESAWNLQYKTASGSWSNSITVNNTPSYNLTGLTPATAYQVRVLALCDITTSSDWATASFTTQTAQEENCPAPTNVTATDIQNHSALISWTQEPNTANSWDIVYKPTSSSEWLTVTTTSNPYMISNLLGLTAYDVQIIAHCTNGQTSAGSEIAHFTTTNVGVNEYDIDGNISIFPNPTTGMVQVSSSKFQVSSVDVYDVYGKLLKTDAMIGNNTVDLSSYAAGVYFLRVSTENGVVTKRVVKK
ncbi:MAG: fibronectin type III domain-containing protein, partial [Bacteroidales bacterium]|nr:fibronectin type III domain-containing protein [Bacteroidales bacterium]